MCRGKSKKRVATTAQSARCYRNFAASGRGNRAAKHRRDTVLRHLRWSEGDLALSRCEECCGSMRDRHRHIGVTRVRLAGARRAMGSCRNIARRIAPSSCCCILGKLPNKILSTLGKSGSIGRSRHSTLWPPPGSTLYLVVAPAGNDSTNCRKIQENQRRTDADLRRILDFLNRASRVLGFPRFWGCLHCRQAGADEWLPRPQRMQTGEGVAHAHPGQRVTGPRTATAPTRSSRGYI